MKTKAPKRIKRSFSSISDVLKIWAAQSQPYAYCRNGSAEGKSAYSYGYHYLLARIIKFKGKEIAVINKTKYSNTTTGHSWSASGASKLPTYIVVSNGAHFTSNTTDAELRSAVIAQLLVGKESIEASFESMRKKERGSYVLGCEIEETKEHNDACLFLGLKNLTVKIQDSVVSEIKMLIKNNAIANRDHAKRKQTSLVLSPQEKSYVERAKLSMYLYGPVEYHRPCNRVS